MEDKKVLDTAELENQEITRRYKKMLQNTYQTLTKEDKKLIRKALDLAVVAHKDNQVNLLYFIHLRLQI